MVRPRLHLGSAPVRDRIPLSAGSRQGASLGHHGWLGVLVELGSPAGARQWPGQGHLGGHVILAGAVQGASAVPLGDLGPKELYTRWSVGTRSASDVLLKVAPTGRHCHHCNQ